jgi:hypothetical protein
MARVTYGSGVTELAGSIGGVTYQKNTSGNIAKLRPKPTVNPSALQAEYQTNMATLVSFWPTLSQANKDTWDAFAIAHNHTTPWGETKTLSGYQWFLSVNLNRLLSDLAILSTAPAWPTIPAVPDFTIQVSATYIRLYWNPAFTPYGWWILYVTLPLRQSSIKLRRSLFLLSVVKSAAAVTTYDFTSLYETFANVTWASFYGSADCSIIARVKQLSPTHGITSAFASAIVKI